jgi:hypothetical protein
MAPRPSFTEAGITRSSQAPPAPAAAAVRMSRSIQEIMLEAVDDWSAKNGMPRPAGEPQRDQAA